MTLDDLAQIVEIGNTTIFFKF